MRTTEMVRFAHFLKTSKFIPACISIYIIFGLLSWLSLKNSRIFFWQISIKFEENSVKKNKLSLLKQEVTTNRQAKYMYKDIGIKLVYHY